MSSADGRDAPSGSAGEGSTLTITINGDVVPIVGSPGVSAEQIQKSLASKPFNEWLANVDPKFLIEKLEFQSVDMFGPRPGFMKFKVSCFDRATHQFLPGIVFMRGGSVGVLVILVSEETGDEFTVVVRQPRLPVGSYDSIEIPAGMLDGDGNFAGKAASELEEETGIKVEQTDLVDLGLLATGQEHPGVFLSAGGSDEAIRFMLYRKTWPRAEIDKLEGKLAGLREHGELIALSILPYEELIKVPDGKTLCAVAMYDRARAKLAAS